MPIIALSGFANLSILFVSLCVGVAMSTVYAKIDVSRLLSKTNKRLQKMGHLPLDAQTGEVLLRRHYRSVKGVFVSLVPVFAVYTVIVGYAVLEHFERLPWDYPMFQAMPIALLLLIASFPIRDHLRISEVANSAVRLTDS